LDEVPYDFVRRRLSILVSEGTEEWPLLITKDAVSEILDICDRVSGREGIRLLDNEQRELILQRFRRFSDDGLRVLALATKTSDRHMCSRSDEVAMAFEGFLLFQDPLKEGVAQTLEDLSSLGITFKIVTGDNQYVAAHVARAAGLDATRVVTGAELDRVRDEGLWRLANEFNVFAEIDPNQKERIILALKKSGHVVGYLGDGINDAPSLHAADVGISVDSAVDVAKEAADFVLLEHDLGVLRGGIEEGRRCVDSAGRRGNLEV
jgi:Mg2+-importing ATPase